MSREELEILLGRAMVRAFTVGVIVASIVWNVVRWVER